MLLQCLRKPVYIVLGLHIAYCCNVLFLLTTIISKHIQYAFLYGYTCIKDFNTFHYLSGEVVNRNMSPQNLLAIFQGIFVNLRYLNQKAYNEILCNLFDFPNSNFASTASLALSGTEYQLSEPFGKKRHSVISVSLR